MAISDMRGYIKRCNATREVREERTVQLIGGGIGGHGEGSRYISVSDWVQVKI